MNDDPAVDETRRTTKIGATAWIAAGSAVNGLAVFGLQVVGTRALGPVDYAPIGVLWTLQYLWIAVAVTAVEAYVTRLATIEGPQGSELRRFLRLFTPWLLVATATTIGIGWMLRGVLFEGIGDLAVVLGLVVLGYGWYGGARGRAAGTGRFRTYAAATAAESVLRLMAAVTVLAVVATTRSLAWVFPLGPLLVVAVMWPRGTAQPASGTDGVTAVPASPTAARDEEPRGADGRRRRVGTRFLAATSTANASVQFLLAGGPLVLLPLGADAVTVSVFFTTITAARVPMTFALNGGLSRLLPPLTRLAQLQDAAGLRRASQRLILLIVATAALSGTVASLIGPDLVALLFGEAFRPSRGFIAIIGIGTVLAVGGLLLDQVFIATDREARLPVTWIGAVVLAGVLVILLPGAPEMRVAGAFTIATGVAVTLLAIPLLARSPADR